MANETSMIDEHVEPSGAGCVECDASGSWWVHLRRCAACGHIGCCDDSVGTHATGHWLDSGHAVIQSYEPEESWFWDFRDSSMFEGPELAAPTAHPHSQSVPGPEGRVPADWLDILSGDS